MEEKVNSPSERVENIRLVLVLVVLFGIVLGFVFYLSWPSMTGTSATLEVTSVYLGAGFDLMGTSQITLYYDINIIPSNENGEVGDEIYVSLSEDDEGIARYKSFSLTMPSKGLFLKGEIVSVNYNQTRVLYGIESYSFEKGASLPNQNITAEIKVSASGKARVINLFQNEELI